MVDGCALGVNRRESRNCVCGRRPLEDMIDMGRAVVLLAQALWHTSFPCPLTSTRARGTTPVHPPLTLTPHHGTGARPSAWRRSLWPPTTTTTTGADAPLSLQ